MTTIDAAHEYLALGLHPIPILPNKKIPAISWARYMDEKPTEEELTEWFAAGANIAIVLGRGVIAVDLDGDGAMSLLSNAGIELPALAPRSKTARGQHIFLKAPDIEYDCTGLLNGGESNVDVRGKGYVLAPPSVHPSGFIYYWEVPIGEIPDAPTKLLELMEQMAVARFGGSCPTLAQRERNNGLKQRARERGAGWLSVNRFGAICLNSLRVLFADIDDFRNKSAIVNARIDDCANSFGLAFRVYRTAAGHRLIEMTRLFDPRADEVTQIFRRLGVDQKYIKCTRSWNNFRARLTPKPWRATLEVRFDRDSDIKQYMESPKWKVAEYARDAGVMPSPLDPEIEKIVSLHDEFCLVNGQLPLA